MQIVLNHPSSDDKQASNAAEVVAAIALLGRRAIVAAADITSAAEVQAMVQMALAEFGKIDVRHSALDGHPLCPLHAGISISARAEGGAARHASLLARAPRTLADPSQQRWDGVFSASGGHA